jgi:hypothetical protein
LSASTNRFDELTVANLSGLDTNIAGLTQGVYTGVLGTVGYTGVTAIVIARTYAWGFVKSNSYGTSVLSIAGNTISATNAGATSTNNYFTAKVADTNLVLTLYGTGESKSDVSGVYVRQATNGDVNAAGYFRAGLGIIVNGVVLSNLVPQDLSGYVELTNATYTTTVALAASALQSETLWQAASNTVVYTNDSRLTDARTPTAHNQDYSTIMNAPWVTNGTTDHTALTNVNGSADVQHLTAAEKAIATNPAVVTNGMFAWLTNQWFFLTNNSGGYNAPD